MVLEKFFGYYLTCIKEKKIISLNLFILFLLNEQNFITIIN